MTTVAWTTLARAEFRKAIAHIARDNPYAARRVQARIESAADDLARLPRRGTQGSQKKTHELVIPGLPYTLVYECDAADEVYILRLWHQKRRRKQRQ